MVLDDWRKAAGDTALVVNATSAGMKDTPSLDLALEALPKDAAVCDIVYNPLETDLLKRARALVCKTIDGLGHADASGGAGLRSVLWRRRRKSHRRCVRELEKALADG